VNVLGSCSKLVGMVSMLTNRVWGFFSEQENKQTYDEGGDEADLYEGLDGKRTNGLR
jgi:hypothetical protein